ncbi:MAG: tetratricopeptide repeat protein, partial [Patescibacteria group bacterium]|nr:tetratricopeptide repeat protein [Patescibacteria group bacterium]
ECAATGRFDTTVPWLMIQVIEGAGKDIDAMRNYRDPPPLGPLEAEKIWTRNGHYDLARPVLLGYAAAPNSPLDKRFVQTLHLWIAISAASWGDGPSMPDARELADALGDDYVPSVLSSRGFRPRFAVSRVYAMTGAAAADCVRADKMIYPLEKRDPPGVRRQAFDLYVQAEKATDDPRAAIYFKARKVELETDIKLEAGGWVDVTFEPEFIDIYHHSGDWTWEDEHTIVGASRSGGEVFLRLDFYSKPPLEFQFDMEQLPTGRQQSPLGLRIGRVARSDDSTRRGRMFWANPSLGEAGITECPAYPKYMEIEKNMNQKLRMHVRVWPEHHEFYVNGKSCEYVPPTTFDSAPPYVLGSMPWLVGTSKARFSNLRIRKLEYGPPPAQNELDNQVAYYSRLIEDYPDYARPWYFRGVAYCDQQKYGKAVSDLRAAAERGEDALDLDLLLGVSLVNTGDYQNALKHLQRQVAATPDKPYCLRTLAYFQATCPQEAFRDGARAVELAEAARKLTKEVRWEVLQSLAVAYAEAGDFEKAIPAAKEMLDAAPADRKELLAEIVSVIEAKKPFREPLRPAKQDAAGAANGDAPDKATESVN